MTEGVEPRMAGVSNSKLLHPCPLQSGDLPKRPAFSAVPSVPSQACPQYYNIVITIRYYRGYCEGYWFA